MESLDNKALFIDYLNGDIVVGTNMFRNEELCKEILESRKGEAIIHEDLCIAYISGEEYKDIAMHSFLTRCGATFVDKEIDEGVHAVVMRCDKGVPTFFVDGVSAKAIGDPLISIGNVKFVDETTVEYKCEFIKVETVGYINKKNFDKDMLSKAIGNKSAEEMFFGRK